MSRRYVAWLQKQGVPLFKGKDVYWQLYKAALIPASIGPCFIRTAHDEDQALLQESGAWFLRYSSDPCEQETQWWYIICDSYDPGTLSSKKRGEIKRAHRNCSVEKIDAQWLSEHGYATYVAAYARYKNSTPVSNDQFRRNIQRTIGGPFEYWGVFVGSDLAGYCQCVVEENNVATNVIKLDPAHLRQYVSYALVDHLCSHYVAQHGMTISNGTRSIAHDTKFQNFLVKLGFRKQFCRLNIMYQPLFRSVIQAIFPFRQMVARLPARGTIHNLQALLLQEEARRQCR